MWAWAYVFFDVFAHMCQQNCARYNKTVSIFFLIAISEFNHIWHKNNALNWIAIKLTKIHQSNYELVTFNIFRLTHDFIFFCKWVN